MAFSSRSLIRKGQPVPVGSTAGVDQQQTVSEWFYGTDDALATVVAAGYFNNARAFLSKGDKISVSAVNSGTPAAADYIVTAVPASGNITVVIST